MKVNPAVQAFEVKGQLYGQVVDLGWKVLVALCTPVFLAMLFG